MSERFGTNDPIYDMTRVLSLPAAQSSTDDAITDLTGDVTASGPGAVAATLATVNANVGTFGSATQSPQVTVNGKGLITAVSNVPISGVVPSAHDILSAQHGDTLAAAVVRGDLIVGNATPKWSRLAIGAANKVLQSNGTDAAWSTNTLTISGNSTINGSLTGGGSIVLPSVASTAELSVLNRVVCLGDSLSVASGTWANQLQLLLDDTIWQVIGNGVSGTGTVPLAAYALRLSTSSDKYVAVLCGINDIISGLSAATIEANLQTIYTALKGAGRIVVAVSITPWKANANWTAGRQTVTDDVNTWIAATAINVDYKIDAYTALENTPGDDLLKASYDSGDGLHPNTTGYTALAATVFAGVTWTPTVLSTGIITSSVDVSLNQSLSSSDSPTFRSVTLSEALTMGRLGLVTNMIRPPVDAVRAIEVYNSTFGGTPIMTVDTTNNRIGINNIAPTVALDVAGNFKLGQASGPSTMTIQAANGFSPNFILTQVARDSWFFAMPASSTSLTIYSGSNSNVITALNTGNVGIGVSPSTRLHVLNTTTTTNAVLESARIEARVSTAATGSAAGFGPALTLYGESATDASYRQMGQVSTIWTDSTDASRTSRADLTTTGPGKCGAWGYNGIDGTARTIIANGSGDVTEGITVQYVASEVTGTDTFGGVAYLEPSDSWAINTDGTNTLTLSCAADGSVTIQRTAGTDTYKFQCWMVWI